MAKPTHSQQPVGLPPLPVQLPPPSRVVVVRTGNNKYDVYEETYEARPVARRQILTGVARVTAVDEIKLWHANHIGEDGYGGAGL